MNLLQQDPDSNGAKIHGKLESIRLQVKQNLLDSLLVTTHQALISEALDNGVKINFHNFGFELLDLYNFIYCLPYIKLGGIFPKFTLFQLRIV